METPFTGASNLDFGQEWGFHKDCLDIWRITGYASGNGRMFFFGGKAISGKTLLGRRHCCSVSLDEFQSGKSFEETRYPKGAGLVVEPAGTLKCEDLLDLDCSPKGGKFKAKGKGFSYDLSLSGRKDASWINEKGILTLGNGGGSAICVSATNLNVQGEVLIGEKKSVVSGKAWLDKLSGPMSFSKAGSHWEWLTIRFFNNEEMTFFSFPGSDTKIGSWTKKDGSVSPLENFQLETSSFASPSEKAKFACGWELRVNNKEYSITTIADGTEKFGAYELWAEICNDSGDQAGLCFAHVMPGTRNPKFKKQFPLKADFKFPWQKGKNEKEQN
jgi:hypothetical protein